MRVKPRIYVLAPACQITAIPGDISRTDTIKLIRRSFESIGVPV